MYTVYSVHSAQNTPVPVPVVRGIVNGIIYMCRLPVFWELGNLAGVRVDTRTRVGTRTLANIYRVLYRYV